MKTPRVIAAFSMAFLSGCFRLSTPYQPAESGNYGYTQYPLAPDSFRIEFEGNSNTDRQRAGDFAFLRSAEVCLSGGFGYFTILSASDDTRYERSTSRTRVERVSRDDTHAEPTVAWQKPSSEKTSEGPPEEKVIQGRTTVTERPQSVRVIRCLTSPIGGKSSAFESARIRDSIRTKYQLS